MIQAEKLIDNMVTIQPIIDSLIEVGNQHLEALKKNDLSLLDEVIQKQDLLIRDFKNLEHAIILNQQALASGLGLPEYKLDNAVALIDSEVSEQLIKEQQDTKQKLEQLKHINELNNMIVKQNLVYTQKLMQAVNKLSDNNNSQTYSQRGQVKQDQSNSLLNKQV